MVRRKRWIAAAMAGVGISVAALGLALGMPGGLKGEPSVTKGPAESSKTLNPVAVTTEAASARPVQRTVTVVGSLYGREEVAVSAKVEGAIQRIHHDVGDEVRPGDVLVELDTTDTQLAVAEAQRGLELELAKLGLKEPPPESFDVTKLPAVARAAAKEKYVSAKHERASKMRGASVSAEEFQQVEFEERDAREAHLRPGTTPRPLWLPSASCRRLWTPPGNGSRIRESLSPRRERTRQVDR